MKNIGKNHEIRHHKKTLQTRKVKKYLRYFDSKMSFIIRRGRRDHGSCRWGAHSAAIVKGKQKNINTFSELFW